MTETLIHLKPVIYNMGNKQGRLIHIIQSFFSTVWHFQKWMWNGILQHITEGSEVYQILEIQTGIAGTGTL